MFSSRHPNRLKVLIEEAGPGAYSGTAADAALFGDAILFSPNFWGVDDALEATGPLKGKTVIDATNPLVWNPNGRMVRSGVLGATERNPELGITFLMSSRIKCGVSGANVLWERTAGDSTPHYPKTLLLSGSRLVGEEDAR